MGYRAHPNPLVLMNTFEAILNTVDRVVNTFYVLLFVFLGCAILPLELCIVLAFMAYFYYSLSSQVIDSIE